MPNQPYVLRISPVLKAKLEERSARDGRSINASILSILEAHFGVRKSPEQACIYDLQSRVSRLEELVTMQINHRKQAQRILPNG